MVPILIQVKFKTLMPNPVKNWIESKYDDVLNEASNRFYRAFCQIPEFKSEGLVLETEFDEHKQVIGTCSINLNVNNEQEARKLFSELFSHLVKKKQKFKFLTFSEI